MLSANFVIKILSLASGVLVSRKGSQKTKSGTKTIIEANKDIEKYNQRNTQNIKRLTEETEKTKASLEALGKKECDIIKAFEEFLEVWEKIKNKSQYNEIKKNEIKLPEYDLDNIKKTISGLSSFLDIAKEHATGMLISLSCRGVSGTAFSNSFGAKDVLTNGFVPTTIGTGNPILTAAASTASVGLVSFIVGCNLEKKGEERLQEAEDVLKQVVENEEKINLFSEFCGNLRDTSNKLYLILESLQTKYKSYMVELHRIADKKDEGFSESDIIKMKNAVLLVSLLYKLCALELVKGENGDELNTVEVVEQIEKAKKIKETL